MILLYSFLHLVKIQTWIKLDSLPTWYELAFSFYLPIHPSTVFSDFSTSAFPHLCWRASSLHALVLLSSLEGWLIYWVAPKLSGFFMTSYGKTQRNFSVNPVLSSLAFSIFPILFIRKLILGKFNWIANIMHQLSYSLNWDYLPTTVLSTVLPYSAWTTLTTFQN